MGFDFKQAKKTFSRIGMGLSVILLVASLLQALWVLIPKAIWGEDNWLASSSWGIWVGSFAPMYLIAVPLGLLILKKLPGTTPRDGKMSLGRFLLYLLMAYPLMYGGSFMGVLLSSLLSGGTAENALTQYAMDTSPLKIIVMVILAPLMEEFIFRKQIIDRVGKYGEKTAVLFSGLLFGLFHQNLFQFFYAFFTGCLFAHMYIRTGRLRYPALLHGIINFQGAVVAPWILGLLDLDAISNIDPNLPPEELLSLYGSMMPGLAIYLLYALLLLALSFAGLVVLIVKLTQLTWRETELELPRLMRFKAPYLNVGVIVLVALCIAGCVYALF